MGAQVSSSMDFSKAVTNAVASAVITNNSSCNTSAIQNQSINFGTVKGNFTIAGAELGQTSSVNLSCLQESSNSADLASKIMNNLKQAAQAEASGQNIGVQISNSMAVSDIVNNISQSINITNIKACLASSNQSQVIGAENVGGNVNLTNIKMSQAVNLVASCIQKDATTAKLMNQLSNTIQQETKSSTSGFLNFNGNTLMAIAVIVIGLIVLSALLKSHSQNVKGTPQQIANGTVTGQLKGILKNATPPTKP